MEWSHEKVQQLIDLYRDHSVLWDCKMKAYKDKNKRHDALIEIATSFNVHKDEIERKIKNLLSHFAREIKKENEAKKSGSEND